LREMGGRVSDQVFARAKAAFDDEAIVDLTGLIGYYTLLAGQLDHHEATVETSKGLSQHFPIPVAILARLAVDVGQQGGGIGAALLNDALVRVVRASEEVAVRAIVVHAVDENASSFYTRFGFRALSHAPLTLMATLSALRAAGYR